MAEMEILEIEESTNPNKDSKVFINENGVFKQAEIDNLLRNSDTISDVNTSLEINGSKNILPNSIKSGTYNGGTVTVNKDGSVTINGTFTATASLSLLDDFLKEKVTEGKTYILSGCPAGGAFSNNYKLDIISGGSSLAVDTGSGVEFTPTSTHINADSQACRIVIYAGTYSNLVFYPMVRLKGTSASYQPYADTNHNLSKDLIDVKNTLDSLISPNVDILGSAFTNSSYENMSITNINNYRSIQIILRDSNGMIMATSELNTSVFSAYCTSYQKALCAMVGENIKASAYFVNNTTLQVVCTSGYSGIVYGIK